MRRLRLVLAVSLVIVLVLGTTACGKGAKPTGEEAGSKGTIAVLNYVSSAPYFAAGETKAIEAGKKAGYDVTYTGTPDVDTPKLIGLIQDMIQKDVKAIVLASGDSTSVAPVLREAREKGIKVVSWDLDVEEDARDLYAGLMDLAELAVPMVEQMVKDIGDEGDFAIVTGVLTNEFLQARIARIEEYIAEKYPKLNIVAIEGMDEDPEKCFAVAQNLIAAYPDMDAIMSNVSTGLGPIGKAIEQEGKIGQIYACGQSTPNLAKPVFESGAAKSAVLWDPGDWAAFATTIAINLVEGIEIPEGNANIDGFPDATREGDHVYFWKTLVFTEDNVDEFDF
ncbi:MAG: substrate-binding domain-containing protein [Clostridiales bacterium]|nr:substrate-binding domain-containing protein [Clostridiales bacterium]